MVFLFLICALSWNNYAYYSISFLYNKAQEVPEQYPVAMTVNVLWSSFFLVLSFDQEGSSIVPTVISAQGQQGEG